MLGATWGSGPPRWPAQPGVRLFCLDFSGQPFPLDVPLSLSTMAGQLLGGLGGVRLSMLGKSCGSDPSLALSRDFEGPQPRVSPKEVTAPGGSPGNHVVCPAKDRPLFRKLASFCESCQDGGGRKCTSPSRTEKEDVPPPGEGALPGDAGLPPQEARCPSLLRSQTMTAPLGVLDATVDDLLHGAWRDARRGALLL